MQTQFLAAQDVEMQVMHSLAGILAAVGYHPVAACQLFCGSDLGDDLKNVGNHSTVFGVDAVHRGNVRLGNHQNVGRCLGVDVTKCQDSFILINFGGGNFAGNNFTE